MLTKDKLLLFIYVNIGMLCNEDIPYYLNKYADFFDYLRDESCEILIVPIREGETHIDCIDGMIKKNPPENVIKALEKAIEEAKIFEWNKNKPINH